MVFRDFAQKIPIRMGTDEEFALVAGALKLAHFDEETLLSILKIERMSDVGSLTLDKIDLSNVSEQLRLLIRLFIFLGLVPRADVERAIDRATLDAFESLGILRCGDYGEDQFYTTILLYPVAGFLIASDRHSNPDFSTFTPSPDIVFPAIYGGTLRFLKVIPRSQAEDVIDLCGGSGIGAFLMGRTARHAVSSDITERATAFVRFNCALNRLDNVEAVCGDLYGGVEGRTFDRITAHPPYVPSLSDTTIWRDGGRTGEALVRRIIEGVPRYLRKGGLFCIVSIGLDTAEGLFEERTRNWMGETSDEFDIIFAYADERAPEQVLRSIAEREQLEPDEVRQLAQAFADAGTLKTHYGVLIMRRREEGAKREPWTMRTRWSEETNGQDVEWAFSWHDRSLQPDFLEEMKGARPRLSPRLQVHVTHVVHEGSLVPAEFVFETDKPFDFKAEFEASMIPVIVRFDGALTTAEVYQAAIKESDLPDNFTLEDFTRVIAQMVERGVLEQG
ncbi:MAG TPA: methyltransferase [Pyrinomonadaceae bacterium]|nr:methyltransferase [Pyrinomonadaceae bacterium]